jgi:hypothetical protein
VRGDADFKELIPRMTTISRIKKRKFEETIMSCDSNLLDEADNEIQTSNCSLDTADPLQ